MDLLIFDMDGVLIDVSRSYRQTIRRTVDIYLKQCLGFRDGNVKPVSEEDIALFKSAGGFNNDWDLTSGLLLYLLSLSDLPPCRRGGKFSSMLEVLSNLKRRSEGYHKSLYQLMDGKDCASFTEKVEAAGGGLRGIRRVLKSSWDGWIYGDGDLQSENVVKRIFQEVYLGRKFTACYGRPRLFYGGEGLYLQERLLIPKEILSSLRKRHRLGIASGRPRFEAELALKRFGLSHYFDSVVTLDDCLEEEERLFRSTGKRVSLLKPHPYSLLRVSREIGIPNPRCAYVGDVVDDMAAARRAKRNLNLIAIGFLAGKRRIGSAEDSLLKAGADRVVHNLRELLAELC